MCSNLVFPWNREYDESSLPQYPICVSVAPKEVLKSGGAKSISMRVPHFLNASGSESLPARIQKLWSAYALQNVGSRVVVTVELQTKTAAVASGTSFSTSSSTSSSGGSVNWTTAKPPPEFAVGGGGFAKDYEHNIVTPKHRAARGQLMLFFNRHHQLHGGSVAKYTFDNVLDILLRMTDAWDRLVARGWYLSLTDAYFHAHRAIAKALELCDKRTRDQYAKSCLCNDMTTGDKLAFEATWLVVVYEAALPWKRKQLETTCVASTYVAPYVAPTLAPYGAAPYGAAPYGAVPYGAAPYGAAPYVAPTPAYGPAYASQTYGLGPQTYGLGLQTHGLGLGSSTSGFPWYGAAHHGAAHHGAAHGAAHAPYSASQHVPQHIPQHIPQNTWTYPTVQPTTTFHNMRNVVRPHNSGSQVQTSGQQQFQQTPLQTKPRFQNMTRLIPKSLPLSNLGTTGTTNLGTNSGTTNLGVNSSTPNLGTQTFANPTPDTHAKRPAHAMASAPAYAPATASASAPATATATATATAPATAPATATATATTGTEKRMVEKNQDDVPPANKRLTLPSSSFASSSSSSSFSSSTSFSSNASTTTTTTGSATGRPVVAKDSRASKREPNANVDDDNYDFGDDPYDDDDDQYDQYDEDQNDQYDEGQEGQEGQEDGGIQDGGFQDGRFEDDDEGTFGYGGALEDAGESGDEAALDDDDDEATFEHSAAAAAMFRKWGL